MKLFKRYYYPLMITLSTAMMMLAFISDSTPGAIFGGAFLLSTSLERLGDSVKPTNIKTETTVDKRFKPYKPLEDTVQIRKYKTILDNIDAYDGSGKNQQKVR